MAAAAPLAITDGHLPVPTAGGLGVTLDPGRVEEAHDLHEREGLGARDDTVAMRLPVPGRTFEPKRPALDR